MRRGRLTATAAFVVALAVFGLTQLVVATPSPTGDEPHYALEALSLVRDGDRDLTNQYADPDLVRRVAGATHLAPQGLRYPGREDRLVSVHNPGVAVLLAPAAALSSSLTPLRVEMVIVSALAAMLAMVLLQRTGMGTPVQRWMAWAAVVLCGPFVFGSAALLGEVPAATLVLGAAVLLTGRRPGPWALCGASTAAALLPWLNMRFVPLAAVLVLAAMWVALRSERRLAATLAIGVPLVCSGVGLAVGFLHWYGSLSPSAQYVFQDSTRTWSGAYRFGLGTLLSPVYGLLPSAPVLVLALAAGALAVSRIGPPALLAAAGTGAYLVAIAASGVGFPGSSFSGRMALVFVPLLAVPLLVLLADRPSWRWAFGALLALSLALTARTVVHPGANSATAASGPPGSALARYAELWPDFDVGERTIDERASPAQLRAGHGRVVRTPPLPPGAREAVAASPGRSGDIERWRSTVPPTRPRWSPGPPPTTAASWDDGSSPALRPCRSRAIAHS